MNDDTLDRFLSESRVHLRGLRERATSLDHRPSPDVLAEMHVDLQAIAAACGFLGLKGVWTATRQAETVVRGLRTAAPNGDHASVRLLIERLEEIDAELDQLEAPKYSERDSTPGPVHWAVDDDFDSHIFDEAIEIDAIETDAVEEESVEEGPVEVDAVENVPYENEDRSDEVPETPQDINEPVAVEWHARPMFAAEYPLAITYVPRAIVVESPSIPLPSIGVDRPRVLVVDDSLFYRELVRVALESEGFAVEAVENVTAAEEWLGVETDVAVVVSELDLPGRSGFDLVESLRSRSRGESIRVIALSSRSRESGRDEALAAGFDGFVSKYSTRELVATIEAALAADARIEAAA